MQSKVRGFVGLMAVFLMSSGWSQSTDSTRRNLRDSLIAAHWPFANKADTVEVIVPAPGFASSQEALDTLVAWIQNKRAVPGYGFVSEQQFVRELRMHDTASPMAMVQGQYKNYVYQFQKSFFKWRAQIAKQNFSWRNVRIRPEKLELRSANGFPATRYVITLEKGKKRWELRYELWWLGETAYWVNKVQFYLVETGN
ncbi:MAG: hypothetical protein RL577_678 [Bacteroidota bacterium]|jgi:hypothetical protein